MAPIDSEVVLRPAREADADEVARLSALLGYPIDAERVRARLRDAFADADQALVVAELDGRVAGLIELRRVRAVMAWKQVEIFALVVDDEHRGRGIGSRLIEEAERWAYDLRCGKVRVRSDAPREEAHSLYRGRGYEATRTELLFEKQLGPVRPKTARFVPRSVITTSAPRPQARTIAAVVLGALLVAGGTWRAVSEVPDPAVLGSEAHSALASALGWGLTAAEILAGLALASGGIRRVLAWPWRDTNQRPGKPAGASPSSPSP